jgi:3-oxoacyl-[acyl-carrier protein] reductase
MVKKSETKHIVISGGAKGLGFSLAESLLKSGCRVSTFSRGKTRYILELSRKYKNRFFYREVNITAANNLKSFIRKSISENGDIYGLINNAAVAQEGILATLPEIEIHKMIAINLEGAIRLTRLCLRNMILTPGGRIINISSIIGSRGYNGLSVYSATKAGLDGFTRSLARELGQRQITVNSVAPGYMQTDMSSGLSEDRLKQIVRRTPMKKLAGIEDIIPLVKFLLSESAGMITGQTIMIDGGISC